MHAAALSCGNRGVLIPGKSGSGKSALVSWLTARGVNYLTDELVFLSDEGLIKPLTRPIFLNADTLPFLDFYENLDKTKIVVGRRGVMIPHRILNPKQASCTPVLSKLFFPDYQPGVGCAIEEISAAKSCLKLIESHVNARNLPSHGFSRLADLARRTTSYRLTYGSFDGLFDALCPILFDDN